MQFSSIRCIDRTLSGDTTPDQSGPWSNGSEGVLRISQCSSITGMSLSDSLVLHPGSFLREFYPSAEMQSVYSAVPADWASEWKSLIYECQEKNKKFNLNFFLFEAITVS